MSAALTIVVVLAGVAQAESAKSADAVSAYVTLTPPVIPFHKQAIYSVVVEAPADVKVTLPEMVGKFGGLGVYGVPERKTEHLRGGRQRNTESYTLDPILVGDYPMQPAEVTWDEGEKLVVPSPALRVRPLTEDEIAAAEYFAPNADLIDPVPPIWKRWQFWTAILGVLAMGSVITLYLVRRRARPVVEAPPALPWEVAYQRLRELDQRHLPKAGKFETYYVDLSAILRHYIEDRFHLHAPEQTTPEFLSQAAAAGVLREDLERLVATFLRHCDRVKFAQYRPTVEEMERAFADVLSFVDETVPAPEPQAREEAA